MNAITIPKKFIKDDELVIIPRKKYDELIALEQYLKQRREEEADTDEAIDTYKKEKRHGTLLPITSLADIE